MKNNIIKKFIVLFSLGFVLLGYNFVYAENALPITPVGIQLKIITDTTLYDDAILVNPCDSDNKPETPDITTPYCAIKQLENLENPITSDWSWFDWGSLLNSIGDVAGYVSKDSSNNDVYHYWSWSLNGEYASVGLSQYELKTDDVISLNFVDPKPEVILPEPVNINLKIYAGDTVLFDGPLTVHPCLESPALDAPMTVNGKCAVEQILLTPFLSNTWTWAYAPSGWLDELGGYKTTTDYSKFWSWFNNLTLGGTGLNQHILSNDEELLLTYGSYPLRITASKNSGIIGDTITFTAEEESTFNSNPPYDMLWTKSSGVTIILGNQSCVTILDGTCSIATDSAGTFNATGSKTLYVPAKNLTIEISNPNSGGSSSGSIPKSFSVPQAISFLSGNQKNDGSFGDSLYTDWVAIAAIAGNNSNLKSSISNYLLNNQSSSSVVTDYERRAMALMALGINPYSGTSVDYIEKIISTFDGTQIGDKNLFNDDIFGIIVLQNTGYTKNDEIISKTISYVVSKQSTNGSWGSVDMTSAAIEALSNFKASNEVKDSIKKGYDYLLSAQNNDGGFDNSSSTSWAIQAFSLNTDYNINVDNAIKYLTNIQENDGGLDGADVNNRVWITAYAIPAVLKLPWSDILESFDKPELNSQNNGANVAKEEVKMPDLITPIVVKEVTVPEGKKVLPTTTIKIAKKEAPKKPVFQEKLNETTTEDIDKINETDLLANAGNAPLSNFFKNKIIIATIISVLVISIGGWLVHKYSI